MNRLAGLFVLSVIGCAVGTAPTPSGREPFAGETAAPEGETPEAESLIADEGSMSSDAGGSGSDSNADDASKSSGKDAAAASPEASAPPPCPGYAPPEDTAACKACQQSSATCQPNGCYNGYYCELSVSKCRPKPSGC